MTWDAFRTGALINSIGGFAVLGLALFILYSRPRTRVSMSLGIFCAGFGLNTGVVHAMVAARDPMSSDAFALGWFLLATIVLLLTAPALLLFAWWFPRTPLVGRWRYFAVHVTTFLLFVAVYFLGHDLIGTAELDYLTYLVLWWVTGTAVIVLAIRYLDPDLDAGSRRVVAILGGAIGLYWALLASVGLINWSFAQDADPGVRAFSLVRAASPLAAAAFWIRTMLRAPPLAKSAPRNVALLILGALLIVAWKESVGINFFGELGFARLLLVGVLAYEILVNRLMGLDVKVRWGISKGTVGAALVAAFFAASEAAQQVVGDRFENNYVGIAAAALLVFAIAPLQRLGDRIAAKAVPTPDPARATPEEREQRYRAVARRFLRDGDISTEEKRTLAHLARDLQISGGRAHDLDAEEGGKAGGR